MTWDLDPLVTARYCGLGNLVFTKVEALGEGNLVLRGLVGIMSTLTRITTHGKCARFHPDHFQGDGGVEVCGVILAGWFIHIQKGHRKITFGGCV